MSRGPDIGTAMTRALVQQATNAGCPVMIERADCQRWESATFIGARHQISISASPSLALNAWISGLSEADFAIRDHLVADLVVSAVRRTDSQVAIDLEILTVESR